MDIIIYIVVFVLGLLIGSFLNVCIYRIPENETIVSGRSHCINCNETLKWYDLIPIFSYVFLGGKCRLCKSKLSLQYPIVEVLNGVFYIAVFYIYGWSTTYIILLNLIYSLAISVCIIISVIDYRTYTIPTLLNKSILVLGLIALIIKYIGFGRSTGTIAEHIIGFFAVSLLLLIVFYASKGRGIGGGDVKLMASAGLLLGWKFILLAFILASIFASVIHLIKMKVTNADKTLAFGPYLSAGIIVSILFGNKIINWYITSILQL